MTETRYMEMERAERLSDNSEYRKNIERALVSLDTNRIRAEKPLDENEARKNIEIALGALDTNRLSTAERIDYTLTLGKKAQRAGFSDLVGKAEIKAIQYATKGLNAHAENPNYAERVQYALDLFGIANRHDFDALRIDAGDRGLEWAEEKGKGEYFSEKIGEGLKDSREVQVA